jgi:hypothetical protein
LFLLVQPPSLSAVPQTLGHMPWSFSCNSFLLPDSSSDNPVCLVKWCNRPQKTCTVPKAYREPFVFSLLCSTFSCLHCIYHLPIISLFTIRDVYFLSLATIPQPMPTLWGLFLHYFLW